MNVLGHDDEGVQLISAFATITVNGLEEEAGVVFDDKETAALPGRERYEVGSGWREEASGLQEQTSAAQAATSA